MQVKSVNVGRVVPVQWGRKKSSAIDKRTVEGPVRVHRLGLSGDEIADPKHHGGADKAVYAYAREDLDTWAELLGRDLRDGQFGENLTTVGLDMTRAHLGDRWRVGTALLEVASPRTPCQVFASYLGEKRWVRRFGEHGVPGAYLRVVEEGEVEVGSPISVERTLVDEPTLGRVFAAVMAPRP